MMKSHNVTHTTLYEFSKGVMLEPHIIRLHPRHSRAQKLLSYSSVISPKPVTQFTHTDLYGNLAEYCTFDQETLSLRIDTVFEMEHDPGDNPFAFVIYPFECSKLPLQYPMNIRAELEPCIKSNLFSPSVDDFARELAQASEMKTILFLVMLARCIYDMTEYQIRAEGDPMHPEQTLSERRGACRDLAVLYMEACRCMGIAARFVSGYVLRENEIVGHDLHAWVEAFVPGAGWMGFDPSMGLVTSSSHVAVATARSPSGAAPITGSFRGDSLLNKMTFEVLIREIPASKEA